MYRVLKEFREIRGRKEFPAYRVLLEQTELKDLLVMTALRGRRGFRGFRDRLELMDPKARRVNRESRETPARKDRQEMSRRHGPWARSS